MLTRKLGKFDNKGKNPKPENDGELRLKETTTARQEKVPNSVKRGFIGGDGRAARGRKTLKIINFWWREETRKVGSSSTPRKKKSQE